MSMNERRIGTASGTSGGALDVERGSDVPISTQIYWQLAYQIDSGRLLPGARLPPVRELGAALRVNPNTIMPPYYRVDGLVRVASNFRDKPILTAEQIEDVVAYLATLRDERNP